VNQVGWTIEGVSIVKGRVVSKESLKRFAVRSTRASAQLERRVVPAGYVRPAWVELVLSKRRSRP
jgi:hypothetical protein